jgi:hypothetical protein
MIDSSQGDVICGFIFLRAVLLIVAPAKRPLNWALGAVGSFGPGALIPEAWKLDTLNQPVQRRPSR